MKQKSCKWTTLKKTENNVKKILIKIIHTQKTTKKIIMVKKELIKNVLMFVISKFPSKQTLQMKKEKADTSIVWMT